jgi:NAD(P)-dependent dehydrogenase (short-subunit alcohol dehydrogenase family)
VAVSSIASLRPPDAGLVEACLALDEPAAIAAAATAGDGLALYGAAKHALNAWCRREAIAPQWAGAGIPLNVVALGFFDTPAAQYILSDARLSAQAAQMAPMRGAFPGRPEQAAAALAWCVSPENSMMTGQILFVDGGAECLARGVRSA